MKNEQLKPCPFCGCEGQILPQPNGIIAVICKQCQTKVFDVTEFESTVIARWNRRVLFSIDEIKNYIISQDSRGDILFNLSEENIRSSN